MTGNRSSLVWTEREALAPAHDETCPMPNSMPRSPNASAPSGRDEGGRTALVLSAEIPSGARLRAAALRARRRCGARHPSHRRTGIESRTEGRRGAGRDRARRRAAGPRYRRSSICCKRYERWRRFDSFTLAAATDALNAAVLQRHRAAARAARSRHGHRRPHRPGAPLLHAPRRRRHRQAAAPDARRGGVGRTDEADAQACRLTALLN